MKRRKGLLALQDAGQDDSLINLTPLIDVVFVVLIMFILVAPMLELDRIQLATGIPANQKEMAVVQENSPITIHVSSDDTIRLNSKIIREEDLLPLLREARRKYPHKTPQLFHDKRGHFGTYQTVKNAVESAGFNTLDVILQPG